MKVVAFNGSPREDGNTHRLLQMVLEQLEAEDIETEMVQLGGKEIRGCNACFRCAKEKDGRCHLNEDMVNDCIEKMVEADGIVIGSPTYFSDLTPETKALIDRAGFVAKNNGYMLSRKVGAPVAAVRRAGSIHVLDSITHFFTINDMVVCGSSYWNMGLGGKKGDVDQDDEGVETMRRLGRNMAWLIKRTT
ncbi:MAG: flavodoxin family protein [Methanomassiliicoccales archaeon]